MSGEHEIKTIQVALMDTKPWPNWNRKSKQTWKFLDPFNDEKFPVKAGMFLSFLYLI